MSEEEIRKFAFECALKIEPIFGSSDYLGRIFEIAEKIKDYIIIGSCITEKEKLRMIYSEKENGKQESTK